MSLTFLAKSSAYSWKMSLAGQVLWNRKEVVWATEIIGADIAPAATAAPLSRLRRRGVLGLVTFVSLVDFESLASYLWRSGSARVRGFSPRMVAPRDKRLILMFATSRRQEWTEDVSSETRQRWRLPGLPAAPQPVP